MRAKSVETSEQNSTHKIAKLPEMREMKNTSIDEENITRNLKISEDTKTPCYESLSVLG